VAKFRRFHPTITAGLFLVAGVVYIAGLGTGTVVFSVLGVLVELAAWISMLGQQPSETHTSSKE
jgi:hypothetical protein